MNRVKVEELLRLRAAGEEISFSRARRLLGLDEDWGNALFDAASIGIIIGTLQGELLTASPGLERLLGYRTEELMRLGVEGITHPEDFGRDLELFTKVLEGELDRYQIEKRYFRSDGDVMWGLLTVGVLRDDRGSPSLVAAMVQDITDRKKLEESEQGLIEARLEQREAIELNEKVVQALVLARHALATGAHEVAAQRVADAFTAAQRMISDLVRWHEPTEVAHLDVTAPSSTPVDGINVVIADDTPGIRDLVRMVLEQDGIEVVAEAGDGREAIEHVAEHAPAAVILDLSMPRVDGMTAIPEIRRVAPHTKIIVLSAFDDRVGREAVARGAHAWLQKGDDLSHLSGLIRAVLETQTTSV